MLSGLDVLMESPGRWLGRERVGLITNPTAVDAQYRHAADVLAGADGVDLVRLFGPEHGIRGDAQDMVAAGHGSDPGTGLPVVSLYGNDFASLTPSAGDLVGLDVVIFDIQDVGARYYTYAATLALAMRACGQAGVRVLVLDRPNPLGGGQVEGGGLEAGLENFCGLFPFPQRHGLTVGELARLYVQAYGVSCELDVVPCRGWSRHMGFEQTGLPWVMPSPNMPTIDTAWVYPGQCLLEGTNLSEGRGTTRPFELFGAPFLDPTELVRTLDGLNLPGVVFRPCSFTPMFQKCAGELCGGAQMHVTDRRSFLPYRTGLAVVWAAFQVAREEAEWRTDMYEFRDDVPAIDLLTGTPRVRQDIDGGASFAQLIEAARVPAPEFEAYREEILIYE